MAGPRMDVVMRMLERVLEYEDEVRRGVRIPQSVLDQQARDAARKRVTAKRQSKRGASHKRIVRTP